MAYTRKIYYKKRTSCYEYISKITGNKTVRKEIGKYKYVTNKINIGFTNILIKLKSGLILITNGKTSN
jgi:hypothetical protein